MNNKNSRVKNLINAHGWLGVIVSIILFLIFWAGAISLFRPEIQQWAELPHYPVNPQKTDKPLFKIIENKLAQYPLNNKEHLTIIMPNSRTPYYHMRIDLLLSETAALAKNKPLPEKVIRININPKTGETTSENGQFQLADFIYALHYNLNLSNIGAYLVGVITLFFTFALMSGIYVHGKKIISHFFLYRIDRKRTRLLDVHNVIGTISLPFTMMYAISGLVFNLLIVYQISFLVILYKGDQSTLVSDAGFTTFSTPAQTGKPLNMVTAMPLVAKSEKEYGPIAMLRFYNYGDENAVLQVRGHRSEKFGQYYQLYYKISDGSVLQQSGITAADTNAFKKGREVLASLHFADFAGTDLRILYFVLSLAVAAMIVFGNILWVDKRAGQSSASSKVTNFVSNLTTGTCCGFVLATACAFLAERIMPAALTHRGDHLIVLFGCVLILVALSAYLVNNKKGFAGYILTLTAVTLLITIAADWWMFGDVLYVLWTNGIKAVFGVEIGLFIFSLCSFWLAKNFLNFSFPKYERPRSKSLG